VRLGVEEPTIPTPADLTVKIFADGADLAEMLALSRNGLIRGFTTNPTLMRKAGVVDYKKFAHEVLSVITDRPISFEVFSDDFSEMERQAHEIATWGDNVYVKIPITNTRAESSTDLVRRLSILTIAQVEAVTRCFAGDCAGCVSVFAGRIADSGRDPLPIMVEALRVMRAKPALELIWASPRELLNIIQADAIGCHIITVTADILKKLPLVGKDLTEYSLDTVKMFHDDAEKAGYSL
jgi:transaldolase